MEGLSPPHPPSSSTFWNFESNFPILERYVGCDFGVREDHVYEETTKGEVTMNLLKEENVCFGLNCEHIQRFA